MSEPRPVPIPEAPSWLGWRDVGDDEDDALDEERDSAVDEED